MGKKGGTSWLTVVKRAFRSPSKNEDKKSSRRREENEKEEEEEQVINILGFTNTPISQFWRFFYILECLWFWIDAEEGEAKMVVQESSQ